MTFAKTPNEGAIALVSMLRILGAGEGQEPSAPQEEAVEVTLAAAVGNGGMPGAPEAPASQRSDGLLQHGALSDVMNLLPWLEADYASTLAEKEALVKRCEDAEAGLKADQEATKTNEAALAHRDSKLARAVAEQSTERVHLAVLQREVAQALGTGAKHISEANAKAKADRAALSSPDLRAGQALGSIYRSRLESSLVPRDAGYAEFSSKPVKELEGAIKKVDSALEEE
ncbi:hypothetical protein ZWY2020_040569 [Hordeum vulgare]|nr:hypothetical protein ZWY2020_040569 [Hordeum vulgare]